MSTTKNFNLPDTGSQNPVEVIEVNIKAGDQIKEGQTLFTLESDKATMDIPAPFDGKITEIIATVGSKVNSGDLLAKIETADNSATEKPAEEKKTTGTAKTPTPPEKSSAPAKESSSAKSNDEEDINDDTYASPGVRRLARELDVNLSQVTGTGDKGRISKDDLHEFIKHAMQKGGASGTGFSLPSMPTIDFSQFGPITSTPLSRIKKLTAQNLSRNWLLAPQVTQFDEADITELESFRKEHAAKNKEVKLTPLVFIMKAVLAALKNFPTFNASLDASGENLILKQHYHIGIAVDTPEGLVVPVIRDVDQKSLWQLAAELAEVSAKARQKQLTAKDMQGSSFTISSLGGIGGTAFTPIVNLPNVAILGVSKSQIKPQYDGEKFVPRLMLPLSLSYDHRVIDGAEAARFSVALSAYLTDIRRILLT